MIVFVFIITMIINIIIQCIVIVWQRISVLFFKLGTLMHVITRQANIIIKSSLQRYTKKSGLKRDIF